MKAILNPDFLPVTKAFEQLVTEDMVSPQLKASLEATPRLYKNPYIKNPLATHLRVHWMDEWDKTHPEEGNLLMWFAIYAPIAMDLDELDVVTRSKNMD